MLRGGPTQVWLLPPIRESLTGFNCPLSVGSCLRLYHGAVVEYFALGISTQVWFWVLLSPRCGRGVLCLGYLCWFCFLGAGICLAWVVI